MSDTISPSEAGNGGTNPTYIWCDPDGLGRNLWVMFRKRFVLDTVPDEADLHLFADSAYFLWVNGQWQNTGPIRFDPRYPCYDSYDLRPLCTPGENVITVLVNHFGTDTYHRCSAGQRGGFIAWGKAGDAHLHTGPDNGWKAQRHAGYSALAPKLSFALNPTVIFDEAREPTGWRQPGYDDNDWPAAVPLADTSRWGPLAPRPIPMLANRRLSDVRVRTVLPVKPFERRYSFAVENPHYYRNVEKQVPAANRRRGEDEHDFIVFETWLHTATAKTVPAAMFWGERWLNGEPLEALSPPPLWADMRFEYNLPLKAGWNRLFGSVKPYSDVYIFTLGLPVDAGISVHAQPDHHVTAHFRHSHVLPAAKCHTQTALKDFPYPESPSFEVPGDWQWATATPVVANPAREIDWTANGEPLQEIDCAGLAAKVFTPEAFPSGITIEFDLGHTQLFRPELRLRGAAGAVVDMGYSEKCKPDGRVRIYPANTTHNADRFLVEGDDTVLTPLHPRGGRYLIVTIRDFKGPLHIDPPALYACGYPVQPIGTFACSDPLLNEIWTMCQRTQATDMEDAYIDCPNRERGMYLRDTVIQYHNNCALYGDHALMRRCLELFAQGAMEDGRLRAVYPVSRPYAIADFCLHFADGVRDYYRASRDRALVATVWPAFKQNLQWFFDLSAERADGLLDGDWPSHRGEGSSYGGFYGDLPEPRELLNRTGISGTFNGFYARALLAATEMADLMNDTAFATTCRQRQTSLHKNFNNCFWDPQAACYADDPARSTHSLQVNALAITAGLADPNQQTAIRRFFGRPGNGIFLNGRDPDGGARVSPHFCFYLLEALYALELPDLAETIIRQGWGHMLNKGLRTCREHHRGNLNSFCHAWSAHPAYYLSRYVLGVHIPDPAAPNHVLIKPLTHHINSAAGTWPLPAGPLHVKWHRAGARISIDVHAPPGVKVTIDDDTEREPLDAH